MKTYLICLTKTIGSHAIGDGALLIISNYILEIIWEKECFCVFKVACVVDIKLFFFYGLILL